MPRFPRLVSRLGAPATGLTDFPHPRSFEADAPLATFVSQLLGLRLRQIVEADLAIRGGNPEAAEQLAAHAAQLRSELRGLSFVLDPDWVEDLYDELDWIILDADPRRAGTRRRPSGLESSWWAACTPSVIWRCWTGW